MEIEKKIKKAFAKAIDKAGNMAKLSEISGVTYSVINKINSGKVGYTNVSLGTYLKIFPDMEIDFFGKGGNVSNVTQSHISDTATVINGGRNISIKKDNGIFLALAAAEQRKKKWNQKWQ